jgi:hypothetical protein
LLLREKIDLVVPGGSTGRTSFSALRGFCRELFTDDAVRPHEKQISLARIFDRQTRSPELHGLIDTLKPIRQRILANSVLRGWVKWFGWILIALALIAAVSGNLAGAILLVGVVAIAVALGILAVIWRDRPSHYEVAKRLDSAAGLKDRLSTAIYLGAVENPDGIVVEQRKDALARIGKGDRRDLFPLEWPGNAKRAAALVLIVGGLFAYRVHHQPPLISLLQSTAHSQFVQSILSPIARAMEKDIQRTIALVTAKPDTMGEETQRTEEAATDDLWKSDEKAPATDQQKNTMDAGEQQDQMRPPGDQEGTPSADGRQQDSNSQAQESKNGNESNDGKTQEQSEQTGPQGRQSMGQSLMQALKNMMSKSPNQQSNNNRPNQQPPNSQGSPQSGNSNQPGATESDKRGDSKGNSDAKQKASQTASEGAGSQQGTKELRTDLESHPVNAVPDRVALESSGFKEQTRMKVATETGSAQLAEHDQAPQQDAVTNGSEQENIPARYRFYVQRYFEHADNGKH